MPHSIKWYIQGQVLFVRFQGVMTVEDMEQYVQHLLPFYGQTDAEQVHCLIDTRLITRTLSLADLVKVLKKPTHPRMGWNIQVDTNQTWLRHLTNIITEILRLRSRSFNTFDEGLMFLALQDETIRWERANLAALNPDISAESP